jgi:hypothetical protein
MLISKGYQANDIICLKIANGDEVIAKLVEETVDQYRVSRPCTVVPSSQGIGLMQSLFAADINNDIVISKNHVIMHAPVVDRLKSHYIQTTTGIQTVSKGDLIK